MTDNEVSEIRPDLVDPDEAMSDWYVPHRHGSDSLLHQHSARFGPDHGSHADVPMEAVIE